MKLLVAMDGSGAATRALKQALALARLAPGSSVHLVHAHEEPPIWGEIAAYVPRDKLDALQREQSEAILAAAESELKAAGMPFTREVLVGPVALTIARHAERLACDAIVMGRQGRTALADILVGSVAMKVLHASKLPVMLVR